MKSNDNFAAMVDKNFNFPFVPYNQQLNLMKEIYNSIESKMISIIESPTGTGKSLSLICSTMSWILNDKKLKDARLKELKEKYSNKSLVLNELDWVKEYEIKSKASKMFDLEYDSLSKLNVLYEKISKIKSGIEDIEDVVKIDLNIDNINKENECIIEYDEENILNDNDESDIESSITKVFYCSRTHSQLAQIIKELKKTVFASEIVVTNLGSRQNLCINPKVKNLNKINLINEKCLDLSGTKSKSDSNKCPYKSMNKMTKMCHKIIQKPMNIEELIETGTNIQACPFYSIRQSINTSHLVLVPYQNIFNPDARKSTGINLKNQILVIDEAHNLSDIISDVNSVYLTKEHLQVGLKQISNYKIKYLKRFSYKTLKYLNQLDSVLNNLQQFLQSNHNNNEHISLDMIEFILNSSLNIFNFYELLHFIDETKLSMKLRKFVELKNDDDDENEVKIKKRKLFPNKIVENDIKCNDLEYLGNSMLSIRNFIAALYYSSEARMLIVPNIKYHLLIVDSGKYLKGITNEARSIIVAGGTMQPFSEFTERLFSDVPRERLSVLSCQHVVDAKKQLCLISIGCDLEKKELKFTVEKRTSEQMTKLWNVLIQLINVTPNGVVIFVPSYDFLKLLFNNKPNINIKKKIFQESQNKQNSHDIMKSYSCQAMTSSGAILFAVIGGKLSEGINFDDELARMVIIIGIPYPNKYNPVLLEKQRFVNELQKKNNSTKLNNTAGSILYHNLAMKAVNQAIGRAIRHKDDYSAVILLDDRYKDIVKLDEKSDYLGLPKWMKKGLKGIDVNLDKNIEILKLFYQNCL